MGCWGGDSRWLIPCAARRWMLSCSLDKIKKLKKYNCSPTFQATRETGEDIKQHNKSNTIKSLNIVVFSDMASLTPKIVAICVMLVSSSSAVQQTTSAFSCCEQAVNYLHEVSCDHIWSANKTNIAVIADGTKVCESPCKEINDDGIILDRCVNVAVNTVCHVNGVIKETCVTFYGQKCSRRFTNGTTTGNKNSVVLLLLTFLTGHLLHFLS
ncbi:uncharacterized protein LOC116717350 [Xiphophorus hellerii]|uniref:uncharacterized protein LOC116717350 n=1 Tax=Xiphophorus hellerii TaxID=8084 RepID=UPI0013B42A19|nr:uncharacterized protein LOC116717350 [Xiphophorus hellerii]